MRRLDKIETDAKRRERNTLRDRLLQSYRYYTSADHNPLGEWTKMESKHLRNSIKIMWMLAEMGIFIVKSNQQWIGLLLSTWQTKIVSLH